jgi:hypothetical protein
MVIFGMTNVSDGDIARERDEVVKRMLATPPQPRTSPKKQKPKPSTSSDPASEAP